MGGLIFLGTGDPFNYERTQTALAFPLPGGETLLVDTASGTGLLGQLDRAGIALDGVRHLVMTHRHFDHAGGLAPLLVALSGAPEAHLTVYALHDTLHALRALLALGIPGVEDWLGPRLCWRTLAIGTPVRAGSALVTPFAVDHGLECAGLRLVRGGASIVFSADTRPSQALVDCARGADLLIHEAYGPAATANEAHAFGHSTAADAGEAARAAGVERLLLTHLRASRYADPEELGAEAAAAFGRPIELAHDLDHIEVTGRHHRPLALEGGETASQR